uniref:Uncharacterized protein n=1 Tax=Leptocylindrus danicus TaxID=163516 RepID=A0A7S2JUP0_9STRA|mmetsp:Transcript_11282/g.17111  ORF Transcript_11282/g.17111 Transcript_11282/m.17111 type:complete len:184 (+) Transcript_11282:106-657(+)
MATGRHASCTCPNGLLTLIPLLLGTTSIILSLVVSSDLFKTDRSEIYANWPAARVLSLAAFFLGLLITLYFWSTTCFFWSTRGFAVVALFYYIAFFCQLMSFLLIMGYARDGHSGGKINIAAIVFWFVTAIITGQMEEVNMDSPASRQNDESTRSSGINASLHDYGNSGVVSTSEGGVGGVVV